MTKAEQNIVQAYAVECLLKALRANDKPQRERWFARQNAADELQRRLCEHAVECKDRQRMPNESKEEHRKRLATRDRLSRPPERRPPDASSSRKDSIGNSRRTEAGRLGRLTGPPRRPPYNASSSDLDHPDT